MAVWKNNSSTEKWQRQQDAQIQNLLPEAITSYESIDTVTETAQAIQYPIEFLNSLEPGMPPHNLLLKKGAPIMLLRNLDSPRLCNRTRLCIKNLFTHIIEATILTGGSKGEDVIPRISLISTDMPFDFKRQFRFVWLLQCLSTKHKVSHWQW